MKDNMNVVCKFYASEASKCKIDRIFKRNEF
jgi:hypothetical protein